MILAKFEINQIVQSFGLYYTKDKLGIDIYGTEKMDVTFNSYHFGNRSKKILWKEKLDIENGVYNTETPCRCSKYSACNFKRQDPVDPDATRTVRAGLLAGRHNR